MGEKNRHQLFQCCLHPINFRKHIHSSVVVGNQQRSHRVSKDWGEKCPVLTGQSYSPEHKWVHSRKKEANISSVLMFCKYKSSDYWGHIFEKQRQSIFKPQAPEFSILEEVNQVLVCTTDSTLGEPL